MTESDENLPWERRPGEPGRWYACLEAYRLLGPQRTIEKAYQQLAQSAGKKPSHPSQTWYAMAKRWEWQARAEAWDASERRQLRAKERDRRLDAREVRIDGIHTFLLESSRILQLALQSVRTEEEACKMLPIVRAIQKDMLIQERLELGPIDLEDSTPEHDVPPYTADELAVAARELLDWNQSMVANGQNILYLPNDLLIIDRMHYLEMSGAEEAVPGQAR